jgi:transposase
MRRPMPIGPIPPATARVARAACPTGPRYLRVADARETLFTDDAFLALFPTHGPPAQPPWPLALVAILPDAEGLADRQAAHAVRSRLDWTYVLRLELTDAGFDASVLREFRTRRMTGTAEYWLVDMWLPWCRDRHLVKAGGRQRTDCPPMLAAVRALNRIEVVSDTMRHALNSLALVAPEWWRTVRPLAWKDRYARRAEDDGVPTQPTAGATLARAIGHDGWRWLSAVDHADAPPWLRERPAVVLLRRVWIRTSRWDGTPLHWRDADHLPPAAALIGSPYDAAAPEARTRTAPWVGDNVPRTASCEDDLPHLITHGETPSGPAADGTATPALQEALQPRASYPGPISAIPVFWTPHSRSRGKPTTVWISGGPHASTITGRPAQGLVSTRRIARSMGTSHTRLVRLARPGSAGRRPSIVARIPS